jgi:hypothetical protein
MYYKIVTIIVAHAFVSGKNKVLNYFGFKYLERQPEF